MSEQAHEEDDFIEKLAPLAPIQAQTQHMEASKCQTECSKEQPND